MPRRAVSNYQSALNGGNTVYGSGSALIDASAANTVIGWIEFNGTPAGNNVWQFRDAVNSDDYRLSLEATGKLFTWQINAGNTGSVGFKTNNPVPLREWIRIAVTYNGAGKAEIFINGYSVGFGTGNIVRLGDRFIVYPTANGNTAYSDMAVWNRVLTAQEISRDYNYNILPSSPVLRWKLNEGSGTSFTDSSGNGLTTTGNSSLRYTRDTPMLKRGYVSDNLVYNADFEYAPAFTATQTGGGWIDGTLAGSATNNNFGWHGNGSGTRSIQFDSSNSHGGTYSLKASTLAAASYVEIRSNKVGSTYNTAPGVGFDMKPSTSYTLSYWMKTNYTSGSSSHGAYISMLEAQGDGTNTGSAMAPTYVQSTTGWTKYTFTFTTAATTRRGHIEPRIYGHTGSANLIMDAWFDDIVLKPTTAVTRTTQPNRVKLQPMRSSLRTGASAYAQNTDAIPGFDTAHSFGLWFKVGSRTTTQRIMQLGNSNVATDPRSGITILSGFIRGGYYNGTAYVTPGSSSQFGIDTWHHAFMTWDGTSSKFYLDGVNYSSINNPSTGAITGLLISSGGANGFNGNASQAIVYNRALTATEVARLYRGNKPTGYTHYYPLEDGAGTTATDMSGNAHTATLTSASWTRDAPHMTRPVVDANLVRNGDFSYAPPFTAAQTAAGWFSGSATGDTSASTQISPFGWSVRNGSGTYSSQFDIQDGYKCMKLSTGAVASWLENANSRLNSAAGLGAAACPLLPSTSYTLTYKMKTNLVSGSSTGANVFVLEYSGAAGSLVTDAGTRVTTTTGWTDYSLTFTTNAATRYGVVTPNVYGHQGTATLIMDAWFTNITLKPTVL